MVGPPSPSGQLSLLLPSWLTHFLPRLVGGENGKVLMKGTGKHTCLLLPLRLAVSEPTSLQRGPVGPSTTPPSGQESGRCRPQGMRTHPPRLPKASLSILS